MSLDGAQEGQLPHPQIAEVPAPDNSTTATGITVGNPEPSIEPSLIGPTSVVTSPERTSLRSNALDEMTRLVAGDPKLVNYLATRSGAGISFEYTASALVNKTEDPELKSKLLEILVEVEIAEGSQHRAVESLANAEVATLPIEKYDNVFLIDLFDKALISDPGDAWMMAQQMLAKGDRVLKPSEANQVNYDSWVGFEQRAFEAHAEEVLSRPKPIDRKGWINLRADMEGLFGSARFREKDGFTSQDPSEVVKQIGSRMVDVWIGVGAPAFALDAAREARMPQATIDSLTRQADPSILNIISSRLRRSSPTT